MVLLGGRARSACASHLSTQTQSVILWHDFSSAAAQHTEKHQAVSLDKKTREPTWQRPSVLESRRAVFDGVEHVDALAVFKVKPAVWQQMRWLE